MSVSIVSRSKWGARPWNGTPGHVSLSQRREFFIHYDGGHPVSRTGNAVPQAIDRQHQNQGWAGIGYNFVVDQNGRIYEGRGWTKQGAHCPGHNVSGIGVQIAIGGSQEPSSKALSAARALYEEACRKTGRRLSMKGHRDGFATACPGPKLYAWVQDGMPAGDYKPQSGGGSSHPARYTKTIGGKEYGYGAKGSHVTEVDRALIRLGFDKHHDGNGYQAGPNWTDYTTENYSDYQKSLGYRGADADGVPGVESLARLLDSKASKPADSPKPKPPSRPKVDLSKLIAAAKSNPPKKGQPVTYDGVKVVEAALVKEGLLNRRYADGHFGTTTIRAYAAWQRRWSRLRSLGWSGSDVNGIPGETSLKALGDRHGFTVTK